MLNALFVNHWKVAASARQDISKSSFIQLSVDVKILLYINSKNNVGKKVAVCRWHTDYSWYSIFYIFFSNTNCYCSVFHLSYQPPAHCWNLWKELHLPWVCEPFETRLAVFDLNWFAVTSGRNMRIQTHASQCSRIVMRGQACTSAHTWTDIVHTASLYLSHIHICASLLMMSLHQLHLHSNSSLLCNKT